MGYNKAGSIIKTIEIVKKIPLFYDLFNDFTRASLFSYLYNGVWHEVLRLLKESMTSSFVK